MMKCKNLYVSDTIKFYPKHAQIRYRISPTIKTTVLFPVDKVYNIGVTKLGLSFSCEQEPSIIIELKSYSKNQNDFENRSIYADYYLSSFIFKT